MPTAKPSIFSSQPLPSQGAERLRPSPCWDWWRRVGGGR